MRHNLRIILRGTGMVLHVPGLMAIVSLPICYFSGERYAIWPFVFTALVSFGSGQVLFRLFRDAGETNLDHAMVIAAISWAFVSLIGACPFWLIAHSLADSASASTTVLAFRSPLNALFESCSGFTSTGLSVALDPGSLPRSLQWWRSFTEWVGGAGVIVLLLSIIGTTTHMFRLYYSEARIEKLAPSVTSTVRTIWWIYLAYTGVAIVLLLLVGVPWWEALNHAMTAISTGGFSVTGRSIADYAPVARLVLVCIMLAGATSFAVHYHVLTERRGSLLWRDGQQRLLWMLTAVLTFLVMGENLWFGGALLWNDSLFQVVSALTTTGFGTVDLRSWNAATHLLLTIAMLIGGAAGSTGGGVKIIRILYLAKGLQWRLSSISRRPHQVMRYEVNGKAISAEEARNAVEAAGVLTAVWVLLIVGGTFVMLHVAPADYALNAVIFEVASAQSNVGLSVGIVGPGLHWVGKLVLILHMYLGRLEILPVLFVFFALFGKLEQETQRAQRVHTLRESGQ